MFEREVMISSLRKNTVELTRLVEELEERPRFDGIDLRYCREVLKRVESALRRIRRADAQLDPATGKYGPAFSNCVW